MPPQEPPFSGRPPFLEYSAQLLQSHQAPTTQKPITMRRTEQPHTSNALLISLPNPGQLYQPGQQPALPPMKLPPIQLSPPHVPTGRTPSRKVSINQLLSSDSPSPTSTRKSAVECGRKASPNGIRNVLEPSRGYTSPHPSSPAAHTFDNHGQCRPGAYRSPSHSTSPSDVRGEAHSYFSMPPPFLDRAIAPPRRPQHMFVQRPDSGPSFLHTQQDVQQSLAGDRRQHSPAVSVHSSIPSHNDSQSEPSPIASFSPGQSLPFASQAPSSQPPPLNYCLIVRQQPVAARACGFGERDRRVIDPPPILELKITSKATGAPELDTSAMLALNCDLKDPNGTEDQTQLEPEYSDFQATRRLMGTLVASPYPAKDEQGVASTFFVFSDLSCRTPGQFRLHFTLMRIDPMNMMPGARHGSVASVTTDVFSVYTAKDFPGMRASSALLKALRRQGLNVGVKKGSEARKGKIRGRKAADSDSEDYDSSDSVGEALGLVRRDIHRLSNGAMSPRAQKAQASSKKERARRKRTHIRSVQGTYV